MRLFQGTPEKPYRKDGTDQDADQLAHPPTQGQIPGDRSEPGGNLDQVGHDEQCREDCEHQFQDLHGCIDKNLLGAGDSWTADGPDRRAGKTGLVRIGLIQRLPKHDPQRNPDCHPAWLQLDKQVHQLASRPRRDRIQKIDTEGQAISHGRSHTRRRIMSNPPLTRIISDDGSGMA